MFASTISWLANKDQKLFGCLRRFTKLEIVRATDNFILRLSNEYEFWGRHASRLGFIACGFVC